MVYIEALTCFWLNKCDISSQMWLDGLKASGVRTLTWGGGRGSAVWSCISTLLCIKSIVGDYQGRRPGSVAEMCAMAASGTGPHRVYRGGFLDIPWLALITSSTCGAFRRWFKQLWHFSCLCPCSRTAGRLPLCSAVQSSSLSPSPLHWQTWVSFQCHVWTAGFSFFPSFAAKSMSQNVNDSTSDCTEIKRLSLLMCLHQRWQIRLVCISYFTTRGRLKRFGFLLILYCDALHIVTSNIESSSVEMCFSFHSFVFCVNKN